MRLPLRFRLICAGFGFLVILGAIPAAGIAQRSLASAEAGSSGQADDGSPGGAPDTVVIPGPLPSFLRMAGISRQISPEDVISMLARNAALYGFQRGRPTEYMILVDRYVHQSRELQHLTDANGNIHVSSCDDAEQVVHALGYKFQRPCKVGDASLTTDNPERAFLTSDSGFPLTALEKALETGHSFEYPFPSTRVPILFHQKDWATAATSKRPDQDLLDLLLEDQGLDRLYAGLSNCDQETRLTLLRSAGLRRLAVYAATFDLYGREINIHSGAVVVPGGAEKAWEDLVGASPRTPGNFVLKLVSKDHGWLAAYFDALSRLNKEQQAHFANEDRVKRLYAAFRPASASAHAARGVYARNAQLFVLLASLQWQSNGELQIPGGLAVWQQILSMRSMGRGGRDSARGVRCSSPEELLETLVASSHLDSDEGPTAAFLMLTAMNAGRTPSHALSDTTEMLVASRLAQFNRWFPIFAEFPSLDDTSITQFVTAADRIDGISNMALRANALGAFQANLGLWQIFARQGQIPMDQRNASWQKAVQPFVGAVSSTQIFYATRNSLNAVFVAAGGTPNMTQDQMIDMLAGPVQKTKDGQQVHHEIAARIHSVLDDQRLASLDALFGLYDGLGEMAHDPKVSASLIPMAETLREFEMPRPIFTGSERSTWAPTIYTSRHAELQVRTDLTKIVRSQPSPAQLEAARGELTPFLRDTLVGLNYAYYEPPGAEVLHNNPLFIRSHDFSSISIQGVQRIWGDPQLIGVGATAGGGAYLMGSLADLPYALAATEQDFIAPKNVQALIWREAVPHLLVASILPRWWAVSQDELHATALYQRSGEEILRGAAKDPELRERVIHLLADRMTPAQLDRVVKGLQTPYSAKQLVAEMLPSDSLYLAYSLRQANPEEAAQWGSASKELNELARQHPGDCSPTRIFADFGVPHPTLQLTYSRSLLNMKPVSAFGGNESRMLAESWESNNLYWARLADEAGYSPVMLNLLAPELTRRMVANIFASNIDDWPALSRAMRETGDEFRRGKIAFETAGNTVWK